MSTLHSLAICMIANMYSKRKRFDLDGRWDSDSDSSPGLTWATDTEVGVVVDDERDDDSVEVEDERVEVEVEVEVDGVRSSSVTNKYDMAVFSSVKSTTCFAFGLTSSSTLALNCERSLSLALT